MLKIYNFNPIHHISKQFNGSNIVMVMWSLDLDDCKWFHNNLLYSFHFILFTNTNLLFHDIWIDWMDFWNFTTTWNSEIGILIILYCVCADDYSLESWKQIDKMLQHCEFVADFYIDHINLKWFTSFWLICMLIEWKACDHRGKFCSTIHYLMHIYYLYSKENGENLNLK